MSKVDYINGATSNSVFGMKRYNDELRKRTHAEYKVLEYQPSNNKFVQLFKMGLLYPLKCLFGSRFGAIKHITSQNNAYLLNFMPWKNTIVTCFDLITLKKINEYGLLQRVLIKLSMRGLKKAKQIITISEYSKKDIVITLKIDPDKIKVIYPCVDLNHFYRRSKTKIQAKYNIRDDEKIILYVGSEEPRQNVDMIIKELVYFPKAIFIKVGRPQWAGGRDHLIKLAKELGVDNRIIWTDYVDEDELPYYYSAADVCIYPCDYAGWGLPVVEAMACGCTVICSDSTSLPEAGGNAAFYMNNQMDMNQLLQLILNNNFHKDVAKQLGLNHVKKFNWDIESLKLGDIYDKSR
jgi:glycosyltransferase involved in cell wall biosynthesis